MKNWIFLFLLVSSSLSIQKPPKQDLKQPEGRLIAPSAIKILKNLKNQLKISILGKKSNPKSKQLSFADLGIKFDIKHTRTTFKHEVFKVIWCPNNNDVVFTLLSNRSVFMMLEQRKGWSNLSKRFSKISGSKGSSGLINNILQNPFFEEQILFLGSNGHIYVTEDCGKTFKQFAYKRRIRQIKFHPTDKNYLLGLVMAECSYSKGSDRCKKNYELILTKDHKQWKTLTNYVHSFEWALHPENLGNDLPKVNKQQKKLLIILGGTQTFYLRIWSKKLNFYYSDDFFKSQTLVVSQGNQFTLTPKFVYILRLDDFEKQSVRLHVAELKKDLEQRPVKTPIDETLHFGYIVIKAPHSLVFVHIKGRSIEGANFIWANWQGNVYISDSTGHRLTHSMYDNVRNDNNVCDLWRLPNLEGHYISNAYDYSMMKLLREKEMNEDSKTALFASQLDRYKRSFISTDSGASWDVIDPPLVDNIGRKFECSYKCSLHLHIYSSEAIPRLYSHKNSLGLIIAHGNVGTHLSHNHVGVFVSRDGGLKWKHVFYGVYVYEIGNSGGLIVAAEAGKLTRTVKVSVDFGESWVTKVLNTKPFFVRNIVIEATNTHTKFLLIGDKANSRQTSDGKGVVIGLDFTDLHPRLCIQPMGPFTNSTDFEEFIPKDVTGDKCIKGHKIKYSRRRAQARCHIPKVARQILSWKNCTCTREDYNCDRDFQVDSYDKCTPISKGAPKFAPPTICEGSYMEPSGYRKMAGDTCVGGLQLGPKQKYCSLGSRVMAFGFYLFFLVLLVLILVIVCSRWEQMLDGLIEIYDWCFRSKDSLDYGNSNSPFSSSLQGKNGGGGYSSPVTDPNGGTATANMSGNTGGDGIGGGRPQKNGKYGFDDPERGSILSEGEEDGDDEDDDSYDDEFQSLS